MEILRSRLWPIGFVAGMLGISLMITRPFQKPPALWRLPDFQMTAVTSRGQHPFGIKDMLGRPWVADFIYTSCAGPCPLMTQKMAQLQRELPPGVGLLSFTVDPVTDTPVRLAAYAQGAGADPDRWLFIRGPKDQLIQLIYNGFKLTRLDQPGQPQGFQVLHSTQFVLIDRHGQVRGYYDSNDEETMQRLGRDARAL